MANIVGYPSAVIQGAPGKSGRIQGLKAFLPSDLTGLLSWYDAGEGITLNGADVSQWDDQSGNGNNLVQATPADQPFFNNSGAQPFVQFDGVTEEMAASLAQAQPFTIFLMHRRVDTTAGTYVLFNFTGAGSRIDQAASDQYDVKFGVPELYTVDIEGPPVFRTLLCVADATISSCFDNGDPPLVNKKDLGTLGITDIVLGSRFGSNFKAIDIGELIIYDRILTDSEINRVGNYLAAKYTEFGLSWNNVLGFTSPLEISNIIGWWDGSEGVTLNGADVSQWDDQSLNGNDLIQATAARQPLYVTPGGAPNFLSFDPGELMQTAGFAGGNKSQPNTIFFVVEQKTDLAGATYFDGILTTLRHAFADLGNYGMFAGAVFTSTINPDTTKRIFVLIFNGSSSKIYFNGGSAETGDAGNAAWDGLTLNSRFSLGAIPDQNVFEMTAYNKLLSINELNDLGTFLALKHSLVWNIITA